MSTKRKCDACTLCCKLLPVEELGKLANQKCQYQKDGCSIYPNRPLSCNVWACGWLMNETDDIERPDKIHYIIDIRPDIVQIIDNNTGELPRPKDRGFCWM